MLDGPEFSSAIEPHLNFVVHDKDLVFVASGFKPGEVLLRWDDVSARSLHRLDVERAELRRFRLGVPNRVVLVIEELLELVLAVKVAGLRLQVVDAAETVGIKNELGAVAEMSIAAAVAVAGSDGGGAERAAVIAAHESEHQILSRVIPHDLERILDGLRTTDIEMDAPFDAEALLTGAGDARRHFHLLGVQILAGELRQAVELALQGFDQPRVFVTEARGGVPHLEVEVGCSLLVVEIAAVATGKDFGRIEVVNGVAKGAVLALEREEIGDLGGRIRNGHGNSTPP